MWKRGLHSLAPFSLAPDGGAVLYKGLFMNPSEKQILDRAHQLWEQNGRPDGREDEFWDRAVRELEAEEHSKGTTRDAATRP